MLFLGKITTATKRKKAKQNKTKQKTQTKSIESGLYNLNLKLDQCV